MSADSYELAPVKFSRLAKRGILLGPSLSELVVLGIGASPSSLLSTPLAAPGS